MGQALASGPDAPRDRVIERIRETLSLAQEDAALKPPVRKSAEKALGWLDKQDLTAGQSKDAVQAAMSTVHNLRSVLATVAGAFEDTGRHDLAVAARSEARHLAKRFGIEQPMSAAAIERLPEALTQVVTSPAQGPGTRR
ncbi:MAG: hypothetical protein AAF213_02745 [Pseudomonadota bacterium]